jgi:uncharacterized protein YcbK (DUF882 family)
MNLPHIVSRRSFVRFGLTALACGVASPALAALPNPKGLRAIAFHNLHTDEKLHVDYWRNGKYDRAAMSRINHILRDYRTGDVHPMDPRLIDLLHDLQNRLGNHGRIEIISGYRSPKTNMYLASLSDGVAKNSYHLRGMATDIRIQGVPLSQIHSTAMAMDRGGVGYYPDSEFVHVDVGPVRRW